MKKKIATELRESLTTQAGHAGAMASVGRYRFRGWMSDGTTIIVEVREPTKNSIAARKRFLKQKAKQAKG